LARTKKKQSIPVEELEIKEAPIQPTIEIVAESKDIPTTTITIESNPELEIKTSNNSEIEIKPLYSVQVKHLSLRRRAKPEIADNVLGVITNRGIYEIYKEENGWG
jgi:hypothetical protein